MPQIIVLPHQELCPEGAAIDAKPGDSICETLLKNDIDIEHAFVHAQARGVAGHLGEPVVGESIVKRAIVARQYGVERARPALQQLQSRDRDDLR